MPSNTQIIQAITAETVPPDRLCVRDGQDVVNLVQDFCVVAGTTPEGGGGSQSDSIAQQALQQSAIALSTAQAAVAAIPQRRSSGTLIALGTGDQLVPIVWSPDMPSANYNVSVTIYGTDTAAAAFYGYRVVEGTRTVNSCQIRFDNIPASSKFSWIIEDLATA